MILQPGLRFWNGMALTAMAALAGIFLYDVLVPMPKYRARAEAKVKADDVAQEQKYALDRELVEKRAEIDRVVWVQTQESIGALILDKATNLARSRNLTLTAFRPQKPEEQGELTRLAYVMTLEGPYPGLLAMVRDLETPSNRLSVHLMQIASADEASDLVTSTIGVSAYVEKAKKETEPKNGKN
jgi:Tfp pilus assembly protein PilO